MSTHPVAVTIEMPVVFAATPRVSFTLGPTFDVTVYGDSVGIPLLGGGLSSGEERIIEAGLQAGLVVQL